MNEIGECLPLMFKVIFPMPGIRPLLGPHLFMQTEKAVTRGRTMHCKLFLLLAPGNYPLFIYLPGRCYNRNGKLQPTGQMWPSASFCKAQSEEGFYRSNWLEGRGESKEEYSMTCKNSIFSIQK